MARERARPKRKLNARNSLADSALDAIAMPACATKPAPPSQQLPHLLLYLFLPICATRKKSPAAKIQASAEMFFPKCLIKANSEKPTRHAWLKRFGRAAPSTRAPLWFQGCSLTNLTDKQGVFYGKHD